MKKSPVIDPTSITNWCLTVIKAIHWRKDSSFKSGTGTIGHSYANLTPYIDSNLTPFTKINSAWVMGLTLKWNIIKLLEDNIEENLSGLGLWDDFLDKMVKAQFMKEKNEKLDLWYIIICSWV